MSVGLRCGDTVTVDGQRFELMEELGSWTGRVFRAVGDGSRQVALKRRCPSRAAALKAGSVHDRAAGQSP